jgi:hypothetical protein
MLDCIRAVYDPSAEFFRRGDGIFSMWNFVEAEKGPSLALKVAEPLNPDYRVNIDGIRRLFAAPQNRRPIIHLLADSGDFRLPIQFRFLSLYKIITELRLISASIICGIPRGVSGDHNFERHLRLSYSPEKSLFTHKIEYGRPWVFPFEAENDELFKVMPLIRRVAVRCIGINYPDSPLKFSATPEELAEHLAEMESRGEQPVSIV